MPESSPKPLQIDQMFGLNGQVALVTGATSGIGRRQARALASAGAQVVALGRRQAELDNLVAEIAGDGGQAVALCADLLSEPADDVARSALEQYGQVDILCNTAGINLREPADEITAQSWQQTLTLNLSVPFFLARELVPQMKDRRHGRVINIASLQTERAFPDSMAYGASKGGIGQVTRAMAQAWSADGVCCNAIGPGFFPTELTAPVFGDAQKSAANAAQTAIGRNGELPDLDGVTVFLASAASAYITGQIIYVDGGFTAR